MPLCDIDYFIPEPIYFVNRKCTPTWKILKGTIKFHDLTYVYSGRATYLVNETEFHLEKGDFIYIPEGNTREAFTYTAQPMQCFAVNFRLQSSNNEYNQLSLPTKFNIGIFKELINLYKDFEDNWVEKNPGYLLKAKAILMLILHKLNSSFDNKQAFFTDNRIVKIREYILANFSEKIELEHLAELAGLHPVYLGALFKKVNNCTIKEYLNRIRVNNAENLLATGGYTVGQAAERCGFEDIFYFSKVFKNQKGYPPSNVLKKYK